MGRGLLFNAGNRKEFGNGDRRKAQGFGFLSGASDKDHRKDGLKRQQLRRA
jgi:hypothetical protein